MFSSESDETKSTSSRSLRGSLSGPGQSSACHSYSCMPEHSQPEGRGPWEHGLIADMNSILCNPLDHLRRIRTNQTGRSLVDITGDSDIFVYLHKYFVFLVKAGGQRVIECVLEGPPRVMASPQRSLSQSQEGSTDEEDLQEKPLTTVDFKVVSGKEGFCHMTCGSLFVL